MSYSRPDALAVRAMRQDLENSGHTVWLDQQLTGGAPWWRTILAQIRSSDVFVFAVSQHWATSKPCQLEYGYARDLGMPLLPVQIGHIESFRTSSVGSLHFVDYRDGSKAAFIDLSKAVNSLSAAGWAPPDPLPDEPPVPYAYLMRLGDRVSARDLSPKNQIELVDEIRRELEVENDEGARDSLKDLLTRLGGRDDVTVRTAAEVKAVLAASHAETPPRPAPQGGEVDPRPRPPTTPPRETRPAGNTPGSGSRSDQQNQGTGQPGQAPGASSEHRPRPRPQPEPDVEPRQPQRHRPPQPGTPTFSIVAIVLGVIGVVAVIAGVAGIVCAAIGVSRKEKPAKFALVLSIVGTLAGIVVLVVAYR